MGMNGQLHRIAAHARRWIWVAPLAIGLPAIGVYYLLPPDVANVAYEFFGVAATAAVLGGVALHRPRHARLWVLLGVGIAAWTAGDVVSALLAPEGGDVAIPSFADVFYLAGYGALIIAVGLL